MAYAVPSNDQQGHETTKALELYFLLHICGYFKLKAYR
jgi:hypothetical protein